MYPDLPSDTWEPDPPFHWIEDGEGEDTDGRASLPAVGGSSDGPEPDANSGGGPKGPNGLPPQTRRSYQAIAFYIVAAFFAVIGISYIGITVARWIGAIIKVDR
jgi:hypothetical protein